MIINNIGQENRSPKITDIPNIDEIIQAVIEDIGEIANKTVPNATIRTASRVAVGFVKHLIQNGTGNIPSMKKDIDKEMSNKSWLVREALRSRCVDIVDGCQDTLNKIYVMPNKISYLVIREFVDRVLRAKDAKDELTKFYWKNRADIWPALSNLKSMQGISRQWIDTLDDLREANHFSSLDELVREYS